MWIVEASNPYRGERMRAHNPCCPDCRPRIRGAGALPAGSMIGVPGGPQGYWARDERLHSDTLCDATTTHVGGGVVIAADLSGSCLACYIALESQMR